MKQMMRLEKLISQGGAQDGALWVKPSELRLKAKSHEDQPDRSS